MWDEIKSFFDTPRAKVLGVLMLSSIAFLWMTPQTRYSRKSARVTEKEFDSSKSKPINSSPHQLSTGSSKPIISDSISARKKESKQQDKTLDALAGSMSKDDMLEMLPEGDPLDATSFDPAQHYSENDMLMLEQEMKFDIPSLMRVDKQMYEDWLEIDPSSTRASELTTQFWGKWLNRKAAIDQAQEDDLIKGLEEAGYQFGVLAEDTSKDKEVEKEQDEPKDEEDEALQIKSTPLPKGLNRFYKNHVSVSYIKKGVDAAHLIQTGGILSSKGETNPHLALFKFPPDWQGRQMFLGDNIQMGPFFEMTYAANALLHLGKGGEIVFSLTNGAYIPNEPGIDMLVWGNPFCDRASEEGRPRKVQVKPLDSYDLRNTKKGDIRCRNQPAQVFVSSSPDSKSEFIPIQPCNRKSARRKGSKCVGYVPNPSQQNARQKNSMRVAYGGDGVDFSDTSREIEKIRGIKFKDLGQARPSAFKEISQPYQRGFGLDAWVPLYVKYDNKEDKQIRRKKML